MQTANFPCAGVGGGGAQRPALGRSDPRLLERSWRTGTRAYFYPSRYGILTPNGTIKTFPQVNTKFKSVSMLMKGSAKSSFDSLVRRNPLAWSEEREGALTLPTIERVYLALNICRLARMSENIWLKSTKVNLVLCARVCAFVCVWGQALPSTKQSIFLFSLLNVK